MVFFSSPQPPLNTRGFEQMCELGYTHFGVESMGRALTFLENRTPLNKEHVTALRTVWHEWKDGEAEKSDPPHRDFAGPYAQMVWEPYENRLLKLEAQCGIANNHALAPLRDISFQHREKLELL